MAGVRIFRMWYSLTPSVNLKEALVEMICCWENGMLIEPL
jgi:hypothetical protein